MKPQPAPTRRYPILSLSSGTRLSSRPAAVTLLAGLLALMASVSCQQRPDRVPEAAARTGTSDRQAVLNLVRADMAKTFPSRYFELDFGPANPVDFEVFHFNTADGWAFLSADPYYRRGRKPIEHFGVVGLFAQGRDGQWRAVNILYLSDVPSRRELVRGRKVPSAILPDWIR